MVNLDLIIFEGLSEAAVDWNL